VLEKLNKKSIKYKLRKNTIENLKKTLGLKGEGTQDSPLIIENLRDITLEISLRTKSIYLVLRRLTISKLSIIDSQNVIVKDCFIGDLEITACRNIKFIKNQINSVKQFLCRNCTFERDNFLIDEYSKLINNTYERRSFVFVWFCLGVGILCTFFSVISLVYLYLSLDSIVFLITGISLSIAMLYMLNLRHKLSKAPVNKYTTRSTPEKVNLRDYFEKKPVEEEINV